MGGKNNLKYGNAVVVPDIHQKIDKKTLPNICVSPLVPGHTQWSACGVKTQGKIIQFPLILKINHQKQTRRALQTESSMFSLTTEFLNLHAAFLYCMSAEKLLAKVLFRTKCSGFYFSTFLFVV